MVDQEKNRELYACSWLAQSRTLHGENGMGITITLALCWWCRPALFTGNLVKEGWYLVSTNDKFHPERQHMIYRCKCNAGCKHACLSCWQTRRCIDLSLTIFRDSFLSYTLTCSCSISAHTCCLLLPWSLLPFSGVHVFGFFSSILDDLLRVCFVKEFN